MPLRREGGRLEAIAQVHTAAEAVEAVTGASDLLRGLYLRRHGRDLWPAAREGAPAGGT